MIEFEGNPFDEEATKAFLEQARGEDKVEKLKTAVLLQNQALKGILTMLLDHDAHLKEHHEVINQLGNGQAMLEELLMGDIDEPTP